MSLIERLKLGSELKSTLAKVHSTIAGMSLTVYVAVITDVKIAFISLLCAV